METPLGSQVASIVHELRAGLRAYTSARWRTNERGTLEAVREEFAQTVDACRNRTWGSQVAGLRGTCYRVVRKSMMSARIGTREVPREINVGKIRCSVKLVGALRDLGVRH